MPDVNPILVGMELSGRFIEIIIDLMEKYPEEWSIPKKEDKDNSFRGSLPTLLHKDGVCIRLWSRRGLVGVEAEDASDLEGTIVSPAALPMNVSDGKKLGAAGVSLYKYLILKSLKFERLLEENTANIDKNKK
jgi:hypothetical protein